MEKFRSVNLRNQIPRDANIEFTSVRVPNGYRSPLAVVEYEVAGLLQPYGLRLDIDKAVFVDHFDDFAQEAAAQTALPSIVEIMANEQY